MREKNFSPVLSRNPEPRIPYSLIIPHIASIREEKKDDSAALPFAAFLDRNRALFSAGHCVKVISPTIAGPIVLPNITHCSEADANGVSL